MPTLTTYRRALAPKLGTYIASTATATASDGASLTCANALLKSSLSQDMLYSGKWLVRPSASAGDKVRVISTYASSSGVFSPDLDWTTPVSSGEAFEIHGHPVEPITELTRVINEGLMRCLVTVEFSFSPSSSTATRHSLASAASWLTDPRWIYQVGYLGSTQTRANSDPYENAVFGDAYADGGTVYLDLYPNTYNTTDTIYIRASKPAYYHCRASGGSSGGQSGLSAETDEAPVDDKWLAAASKMIALDEYSYMVASADQGGLDKESQKAAYVFSNLTRMNFAPWPRTFRPIGPRRISVGGRRGELSLRRSY